MPDRSIVRRTEEVQMFSVGEGVKPSGNMLRENNFDGFVVVRGAGKNHPQSWSVLVSNTEPQPASISDRRYGLSKCRNGAKPERDDTNEILHWRERKQAGKN